MKAVENSATIIGLRCTDGVILASEKLVASELHVIGDNSRVFKVILQIFSLVFQKRLGVQYIITYNNRLTTILEWSRQVYCRTRVHSSLFAATRLTISEAALGDPFHFHNFAIMFLGICTCTLDTIPSGNSGGSTQRFFFMVLQCIQILVTFFK